MFSFLSSDPARRAVGTYNSFMQPGRAGSCMRSRGYHITPQEEFDLVEGLLDAIATRPKDWEFDEGVARDTRTGIEVWTASGIQFCRIFDPEINLRHRSQKRLFNALHELRHKTETGQMTDLKAKLAEAAEEAERERTAPAVAVLKEQAGDTGTATIETHAESQPA